MRLKLKLAESLHLDIVIFDLKEKEPLNILEGFLDMLYPRGIFKFVTEGEIFSPAHQNMNLCYFDAKKSLSSLVFSLRLPFPNFQ